MAQQHAPAQTVYDHEADEPRGRRRRQIADWGVREDAFDRMPSRRFARAEAAHARAAEIVRPEPQPSAPEVEAPTPAAVAPPRGVATPGRRTIVIGGHPDRLPAPRRRPPRTAVERVGGRPDKIVGYAVALGFLLILIAVLSH